MFFLLVELDITEFKWTAVICSVIILYAHHGQSNCLNVWKQSPNIQLEIFFSTPSSL